MNGVIYMRTSPNNERYIGQTVKREITRWRQHVADAYCNDEKKNQIPLSYAIRKYGPDAFTVEILESGIETNELLNEREKYWIQYYHTQIKENQNGLNVTAGGDGRRIYDNTDFQSFYDAGYGIAEIAKLTGVSENTVSTYIGASREENCRRCRMRALEKNPPRAVSNYDIETCKKINTFRSMSDAALFYSGSKQAVFIGSAIYGTRSVTAFGFLWKYDDEPMSVIYEKRKRYFNSAAVRCHGLSVTNIETGEVFSKIKDAGAAYNIDWRLIADNCRGKRENAAGYHWRFTGQEAVPYIEKLRRPVLCVEINTQYPSVSEASRQTGIEINSITHCLKGRRENAGGYHWKYLDNDNAPLATKQYTHCKPVLCIETDTVYSSVTEAAEKAGVHITTMVNWLKGHIDSIHAYHWKYYKESGDTI